MFYATFVFSCVILAIASIAAGVELIFSWNDIKRYTIFEKTMLVIFMIISALGSFYSYQWVRDVENRKWVANQCPMYEWECGSKHKYACEVKAEIVGRNLIGNIAVTAYPTC